MTVSVELKLTDVAWLGSTYENKTVISPFNYLRTGGFTEDDRAQLEARGIITSQGGVAGAYAFLFDTVATALSYASIDLCSGPVTLKAAVLRRDTRSVSMTAEGDMLRWSMPANVDAIVALFENNTGSSSLRNVDLNLEGDCDFMLVFSALCDNYRQQVLGAMGNCDLFALAGMTVADIQRAVRSVTLNRNGLTPKVLELCPNSQTIDTARAHDILGLLKDQLLVEQQGSSYYLAGKASIFARSFLVIENVLNLKLGSIKTGELHTTQAAIIQAGIHDILYIEQYPGGLRFTTLSSQSALHLLRDVI